MANWFLVPGMILAVVAWPGPRVPGQDDAVATVRPGQVVKGVLTGETVPPGSRRPRQWQLVVQKPGPIWISLETRELIPDLKVSAWDRPERPLRLTWDRFGFHEYVELDAEPGAYRVAFTLRATSPLQGAFVLRVTRRASLLPAGPERDRKEIAWFRSVLARDRSRDEAPFTLAVLDGLYQVLCRREQWAEVVPVATRAAELLGEFGQHRAAAGWLENRARAEARLGRILDAVATSESAVALRLKAGDRYQAALTLGWAHGTAARERGMVANRARKQRALELAGHTDMPGHALEDLAQVWRELDCADEAREALEAARDRHIRARDLESEVRVTEVLFALGLGADQEEDHVSHVEQTVTRCLDQDRKEAAIILLDHAAEAAGDRNRPVLAERLYRRALGLVDEKEEPRVAALICRSVFNALKAQDRGREAHEFGARAIRLFQRLEDAVEEARTWIELGFLERRLRRRDDALTSFRRARARAVAGADRVVEGRAWNGEGCILQDRRRYRDAARAYAKAFALVRAEGDAVLLEDLVRNRISVHRTLGEGEAARTAAREGAAALEAQGELAAVARVFEDLGRALKRLRDYAAAGEAFTRAARAYRTVGDRRGRGRALNESGNAHAARGDHARAVVDYEQAHSLARAAADTELLAWTLFNLAYSHAYLGQYDRAAEWFTQVVPRYERETGPSRGFGRFLLFVADTYARAGRVREALACLERACAILEERGTGRESMRAQFQLGDLALRLGRRRVALGAYARALVTAAEEAEARASVVRAVLGLDRVLSGR